MKLRNAMFWMCVSALLWVGSWQGACAPTETKEPAVEKTQDAAPADAANEPATPDASEPAADKKEQPEPRPEPTPEPRPEPQPTEPKPELISEPQPEPTPETTPQTTKVAFVLNSNFVNGSFSAMDLAKRAKLGEWKQIKSSKDISGDVVMRKFDDRLFLLHRFNDANKKDRIDVFDLKKLSLQAQIDLDPKANPHDVVVVGGKRLFVSQYGKKELLIFEENKPIKRIDLSSLAEKSTKKCTQDSDCLKFGEGSNKCDSGVCASDGLPEMSAMIHVQGKLFVAIQGLDRNDGFKPVKSSIAVIDTTTDTLSKTLDMAGSNPTSFIAEPNGTFLVVQVGVSVTPTDGGLERLDPALETLEGSFVFDEKTAGANFSFAGGVVVSSSLGYLILNDASFNQMLVQFDPSKGTLLKTLLKDAKLGELALSDKGELLVADKGDSKGVGAGVRVFEASSGKELTTKPVAVSDMLPPTSFVFAEIDLSLLPKP